jgi:hypothetical protein
MVLAYTSRIFRLEIYHLETFPLYRRKMTLFCAEGKEADSSRTHSYFSIRNLFFLLAKYEIYFTSPKIF